MARSKANGRFTRRDFIKSSAAVAAGSAIAARAAAHGDERRDPPGHEDADLVLENGRIHTMDGRNTVASAVAIRDGRLEDGVDPGGN